MLGPAGQRRALHGIIGPGEGDALVLLHQDTELLRWPPDPGYPRLGDQDSGNPGRGQFVATWRATIPESVVLGNIVTRARIVDQSGQTVVQEEAAVPTRKDPGKALLVYVNQYIR